MRGRLFADGDDAYAEGVVIINEALAERFWSAGDPLGERLALGRGLGPPFEEPPRRIVGVVGDVRDGIGLAQEPRPTIYVPLAQLPDEVTSLTFRITPLIWMVRTVVEPQALIGPAQQRLQQAAGGVPVSGVRTLRATIADSLADADLSLLIALTFAAVAVVLAATGVYGLMAFLVQQRVREMGIRLALGADARRVRNLIIGDGMRLAAGGHRDWPGGSPGRHEVDRRPPVRRERGGSRRPEHRRHAALPRRRAGGMAPGSPGKPRGSCDRVANGIALAKRGGIPAPAGCRY